MYALNTDFFTEREPKIRNILKDHMLIDEFLVIFEIKKQIISYFLMYFKEKWDLKSLKSVFQAEFVLCPVLPFPYFSTRIINFVDRNVLSCIHIKIYMRITASCHIIGTSGFFIGRDTILNIYTVVLVKMQPFSFIFICTVLKLIKQCINAYF